MDAMMTVADIERELDYIRREASDDEMAHALEDQLHVAVLEAIAEGKCADPAGCAAAALKTADINFARWCA